VQNFHLIFIFCRRSNLDSSILLENAITVADAVMVTDVVKIKVMIALVDVTIDDEGAFGNFDFNFANVG